MKLLVLSIFMLVAVTLSHSQLENYDESSREVLSYRGDEDFETSTIKEEGRWNKTKKFFKKTMNKASSLFRSSPKNATTEESGLETIDIIDKSSDEVQSSTTETIGFWKRVKNIW